MWLPSGSILYCAFARAWAMETQNMLIVLGKMHLFIKVNSIHPYNLNYVDNFPNIGLFKAAIEKEGKATEVRTLDCPVHAVELQWNQRVVQCLHGCSSFPSSLATQPFVPNLSIRQSGCLSDLSFICRWCLIPGGKDPLINFRHPAQTGYAFLC